MVVFFTEQDLISFGNYLLSNLRKDYITENSENELDEVIQERLQNVSDADLANWAYLVQQSKQAEDEN